MTTTTPAVLGGPPAFPEGLPLVRPSLRDIPGLARRLESILDSGRLTNGPVVAELEETVAAYLGVRQVVAVASCTTGLMLVLQACAGRERVVLPSFTFAATAHAVHWAGGRPVFADVLADTLTLDPQAAAAQLDGAGALLATHLYGHPCRVEQLQAVADAADVPLVYDAAHALGSRRGMRCVGTFGTAEVFSLSPTKVVVAGEGGLIATNDDALADTCRIARDYGNPGSYDCLFPGLNARLSELHAAVALASLRALDEVVVHRNALVRRFVAATREVPGLRVVTPSRGDTSTFKDLTLIVDPVEFGLSATELGLALRAEGIDSRRYYAPPVHRQKAYVDLQPGSDLPVTDWASERVLSPPLWSSMGEQEITRVAEAIARIQRCAAAVAQGVT